MNTHNFATSVRRRWYLIVGFAILGIALASVLTLVTKPTYVAHAKAFVSTGAASSLSDLNQGTTFTQQVVKSYAEVATTPYVLNTVRKDLGLTESTSEIAQSLTVTAPLDTVIIQIDASSQTPSEAANIANAVAQQLNRAVVNLAPDTTASNSSANTAPSLKITQIESATPPPRASSPNLIVNLIVGVVLGALIGLGAAIARGRLDTKFRSIDTVESATGLPVLGSIGYFKVTDNQGLMLSQPGTPSPLDEQYRRLRTNIRFLQSDNSGRAYLITSAVASEGKSTVAINLAIVLAAANNRVLLVDADLRRPEIGRRLGIDQTLGLTDLLVGTQSEPDVIQEWGTVDGRINVIPSGQTPPNPSDLLQSDRMKRLLNAWTQKYDYVLVDAPPVLPVADATILGSEVAGALFVCAVNQVRIAQVRHALELLRQSGSATLGVIACKVPASASPDQTYGYGYGYGYGYTRDSEPLSRA